jgi:hypothetical protein
MMGFGGLTLLATSAGIPRGAVGVAVAAGLAGGAIHLLWLHRSFVRRTALVSAWWWCVAAVAAVGICEALFQSLASRSVPSWLMVARYLAATLTFCPAIAVLNAKRPQSAAWNFVVLALWAGILAMPVFHWWALGRGADFRIDDVWGSVLWLLIGLTVLNYLPTRFALAAVLVAIGQFAWLAEYLPLIGRALLTTDPGLVALGCLWAAAFLALLIEWRTPPDRHAFDRAWLTIRDQWGLFWALRFQERVNAAAAQYGWPLYLSWTGFRSSDTGKLLAEIPPAVQRPLRQVLRGLLRRFVSAEWIATCFGSGVD